MEANVPAIDGFGHIDFTVTDADRSVEWWKRVLGFELVNITETDAYKRRTMLNASSGIAVTLMTHSSMASDRFDERAVGLDHFALRVPDRATLEAWAKRLDDLEVENSGVQEENGGPLIVFRDPDNIQLELWAFDPTLVTANVNE